MLYPFQVQGQHIGHTKCEHQQSLSLTLCEYTMHNLPQIKGHERHHNVNFKAINILSILFFLKSHYPYSIYFAAKLSADHYC